MAAAEARRMFATILLLLVQAQNYDDSVGSCMNECRYSRSAYNVGGR